MDTSSKGQVLTPPLLCRPLYSRSSRPDSTETKSSPSLHLFSRTREGIGLARILVIADLSSPFPGEKKIAGCRRIQPVRHRASLPIVYYYCKYIERSPTVSRKVFRVTRHVANSLPRCEMNDDSASDNSDEVFSRGQELAIVWLAQTCASLSLLGSLVIVVARVRFKQLRTYSFQLVAWLAVCDIMVNLTYFFGSPHDGSFLCYTQAILQQFFQVALIQWALLISLSLLVMASKTRVFDGKKRMPWNHLWAWGVSAALTVGPLGTSSYGPAECTFCWIKSNDSFASWNAGSWWRGVFLALVFVSIVAIVWMYVTVVNRLGHTQRKIALLSSHVASGKPKHLTLYGVHETPRSPASETDPCRLGGVVSVPRSATPRAPLCPSLVPRIPSEQQFSQHGARTVQSDRECSMQSVFGEDNTCAAPRRGSLTQSLVSHDSSDDREISSDDLQKLPSVAMPTRTSAPVNPRRQKRLLKSLLSGSAFQEHDEETHPTEGDEETYPTEADENTNRQFSLCSSGGDSIRPCPLFSFSESTTRPRRSPFARFQRNSQVNYKDWLWSTYPDSGFVQDEDSGGGQDEKPTVLWVNMSASFNGSRHVEEVPATRPLSSLIEADGSGVGGSIPASIAGRPSMESFSASMPLDLSVHRASRDANEMYPARRTSAIAPEGEEAKACVWSCGDGITSEQSITDTYTAAAAASPATPDADRFGTHPAANRSVQTRVVDSAGRVTDSVCRMSGLDVEHGIHGGLGQGNSCASRKATFGNGLGSVAVVQFSIPSTTTRTRGKGGPGDMDKFLSRVKWYPVIYVLCWVFTLTNGIHTLAYGTKSSNFVLVLLAVSTSRLQGLLNFLWYGLDGRLKQAWLQDILYRRTVAFCCRGLRFLCSGPCCTKRDDERNGKTNGLSQLDQAEAGRVVPKIKAKNTEDRDDRHEKRGRSSTTISSPSPPARSSAANEVLAPPSTPTAAYFKQIHTPDRPPRPGRKAAEEKLKDSKKHKKTGSSKPSRGSSASRRRKLSRSLTRKVLSGRSTAPFPECAEATSVPTVRHSWESTKWSAGKRGRVHLNPALPISISMPITTPPSTKATVETSTPLSTNVKPRIQSLTRPKQESSGMSLQESKKSHRWERGREVDFGIWNKIRRGRDISHSIHGASRDAREGAEKAAVKSSSIVGRKIETGVTRVPFPDVAQPWMRRNREFRSESL